MDRRNKNLKAILICVLTAAIIVIVLLVLYKNKDNTEKHDQYIITHYIRENTDIWEVKVNTSNGLKELYKNGERIEVLQPLSVKNAMPYLELPLTDESIDIEKEEQLQIITWNSNLNKSASYINYLKNNGFTELRYAATPSYIEIYMQKDNVIKRIIILKDSIMVADVKDNNLPDIKNYYK